MGVVVFQVAVVVKVANMAFGSKGRADFLMLRIGWGFGYRVRRGTTLQIVGDAHGVAGLSRSNGVGKGGEKASKDEEGEI